MITDEASVSPFMIVQRERKRNRESEKGKRRMCWDNQRQGLEKVENYILNAIEEKESE